MPFEVRLKTTNPRVDSNSLMALERFGWLIYRFSAACVIEPVRAISTAYFRCVMFICIPAFLYPLGFGRGRLPDVPPLSGRLSF